MGLCRAVHLARLGRNDVQSSRRRAMRADGDSTAGVLAVAPGRSAATPPLHGPFYWHPPVHGGAAAGEADFHFKLRASPRRDRRPPRLAES